MADAFARDDAALWEGRSDRLHHNEDRMGRLLNQSIEAGQMPPGIDSPKPWSQPFHLARWVARTLHAEWPDAFEDGYRGPDGRAGKLLSAEVFKRESSRAHDKTRTGTAQARRKWQKQADLLHHAFLRTLARTLRDACRLLATPDTWQAPISGDVPMDRWPTAAQLKKAASIERDTFRKIRIAAGLPTDTKGWKGHKRPYSPSEIRKLIRAVTNGPFASPAFIAGAWEQLLRKISGATQTKV